MSIILIILCLLIVWQTFLNLQQRKYFKGFSLLLEKFVEINQEFYESQKNIIKKHKELLEIVTKQINELSILRKYANQTSLNLKNNSDINKLLKDTQKEIKNNVEDLNSIKDFTNSLSIISNNIKILDKVVLKLQQSIEELRRRK